MTTVKVSADDVMSIAKIGIETIKMERLLAVEEWVDEAMKETKWTLFGKKPKYNYHWEALAAMKKPFEGWEGFEFYGRSYFAHYSRYYKRDDERKLIALSNMAQSSIDGAITLDEKDHALIRSYATNWVWLAEQEQ